MALQLSDTFKGVSGNYWKIIEHHADHIQNITTCVLAFYKDQATRDSAVGNYLCTEDPFHFTGSELSRTDMYGLIKLTPKYLLSTDI